MQFYSPINQFADLILVQYNTIYEYNIVSTMWKYLIKLLFPSHIRKLLFQEIFNNNKYNANF